ncbi:glycosyltransferase family 2 protein [Gigaspora rosea]|uniref:chitin synthase n=1 Tax=Gigaspora rosea TaxID=44941 RepID=A0A397VIS2_9GLOM|nr:glycosyltransferase family 2 protein [Gigaspora rosea]CAG8523665.1 18297_t:CDS:2 [Gigaspora rosea]
MEEGYGSARLSRVDRRKTLIRPERYQAAAPMLPGKEKDSFDIWVLFSKLVTFWAPGALLSSIGGLHDEQSQQAWREKVALCFIATVMGGAVAFLTVGFAAVLCPPDQASNPQLFKSFGEAPGHLGILGWQFDVSNAKNPQNFNFQNLSKTQNSQDITNFFSRDNSKIPACQEPSIQQFAAVKLPLCVPASSCPLQPITESTFKSYNIFNTTKKVGFDWDQVQNISYYMVIDGNVLNLKNYIAANPNPVKNDTLDTVIRDVLNTTYGRDATRLFVGRPDLKASVDCLVNKYYAGNIDKQTIGCFTSQLFLYVSLTVILSIVLCRFAMACVFDWFISHRLALEPKVKNSTASMSDKPWTPGTCTVRNGMTMDDVGKDLFTILLVTCYSEDEVGIRCTCESMAATEYPDDRKLLFLICDGIIIGSGNEKSTPDICVGLMELEPEFSDPQPQSYIAVAAGSKQHNMAKVYAGFFPYEGRRIPMVCVVKCGAPEEQGKPKPGNRGKRDSQLILMNFFSRVTYNDRMCALDYDLFRKLHHLMGVTPDFFEIVLMVDADTKVYPNSLRLLINCMYNDPFIMGLCGETKIANKRDSWVTAIQVFEYYISHHLGKGFESVFGGVTCLPGCFCMYRLKARKGDDDWVPIITKPEIVHEYSQNVVETLHQKNLLLLGEDRFLTTLMLRNFPHRKMMFCPQAVCKTVVPDSFKVLLSQRRRWINSTIHNLLELVLVRNLCGTFCFSMQFVVFMELIGTVVLPVAIVLTYALIVSMIVNPPHDLTAAIPLIMLFLVLGLPAVLILITTRKLIYIAWMFVYLLALPIWNFVLPTYAYWHFDDFSWGETRKVEGEDGGDHGKKEGSFDANKVPLKRWEDWERARLRRNKRAERQDRQNQPKSPTHLNHQVYNGDDQGSALLASNYVNYEADYQDAMSMHSTASGDIGPQQQYYDYSTNRYPPQDYDRYQQFGNTHDLQRAPSPRPPENNY